MREGVGVDSMPTVPNIRMGQLDPIKILKAITWLLLAVKGLVLAV
jgi:hypothetical protein